MSGITVGRENSTPIDLYSKDWGTGQPVVFSHGWALTADAREDQMRFLASRGYRCIAHDRRGRTACVRPTRTGPTPTSWHSSGPRSGKLE